MGLTGLGIGNTRAGKIAASQYLGAKPWVVVGGSGDILLLAPYITIIFVYIIIYIHNQPKKRKIS